MKRVILFAGHYGSGKTNIAVNYALQMADKGIPTAFLDIDIVNPYYRAKDSEELLRQHGIEFISSEFANSNVDVPALPNEMYAVLDRPEKSYVLDVGGDDRIFRYDYLRREVRRARICRSVRRKPQAE